MPRLLNHSVSMRQVFHLMYTLGALSLSTSTGYAQSRDTALVQDSQFLPSQLHAKAILPTDTVEIPLEEFMGHPCVEIMINGQGPFRFGLETGAPVLFITPWVAQAVGYRTVQEGQIFSVDSLNIGAARFQNVSAAKMSGVMGGMDGLIGLNVYYDVLTTIDFAHHQVRFSHGTLPAVNNYDILSLQPIGTQIYGIESWINGMRVTAVLDTQNEGGFLVVPSLVTDTQFVAPPTTLGKANGVSIGEQLRQEGRWKGEIRVGGVTFQQPLVNIVPIASLQRWNIGWPTLRQFTLTLDQRARRIRLSAAMALVPPPPSDSDFIKLDMQGNLIVGSYPAHIGEQQGVKPGDIVVSVNDIPYAPTPEFFTMLQLCLRGKNPIRFVIRRGTETKQIILTRQLIVR